MLLENFFGVRHIQFVLLFVAIMVAYGMRSNLSVGIVAMTSNETDSKSDAPVSKNDFSPIQK